MKKHISLGLLVISIYAISSLAYADSYYGYSFESDESEPPKSEETTPSTSPADNSTGIADSSLTDSQPAANNEEIASESEEEVTTGPGNDIAKANDNSYGYETEETSPGENVTVKDDDNVANSGDTDQANQGENTSAAGDNNSANSENVTVKDDDNVANSGGDTTDQVNQTENGTNEVNDNTTIGNNTTAQTDDVSNDITTSPDLSSDNNETNTDVNWLSPTDDNQPLIKTLPNTVALIDISDNYDPTSKQKLTINCSANSQVVDNGDGTLSYLPNSHFIGGIDTFTYTVTERRKDSTFTVNVEVDRNWQPIPATECKIYFVHDQADKDSQLLTMKPDGQNTVTPLGTLHNGLNIESMEIHPFSQQLYAASGPNTSSLNGTLYKINPYTGTLTKEFNTGFNNLTALAFRPNGTLWGWSGSGAKKHLKTAGKWSRKGGIIQIDLDNKESHLLAPSPWGKDRQIESLAWSSDGTVLYASEVFEEPNQKNAKNTKTVFSSRLWEFAFYGDLLLSFEHKCQLPGDKVEGLETLLDGMLMMAIHDDDTLYLFDPKTCIKTPMASATPYSDIESIAWPLTCQSSSNPVYNWEVISDDTEQEQVFCEQKSQWLTKTGTVNISGQNSGAYIETYWQVIYPQLDVCPKTKNNSKYSIWEMPAEPAAAASCSSTQYQSQYFAQATDCNRITYQSQLIVANDKTDLSKTKFRIKGWWPGIPKDADENTLVEVRYGLNIYDQERNPLSVDEITQTLLGGPSLCPKNTGVTKTAKKPANKKNDEPAKTNAKTNAKKEPAKTNAKSDAKDKKPAKSNAKSDAKDKEPAKTTKATPKAKLKTGQRQRTGQNQRQKPKAKNRPKATPKVMPKTKNRPKATPKATLKAMPKTKNRPKATPKAMPKPMPKAKTTAKQKTTSPF